MSSDQPLRLEEVDRPGKPTRRGFARRILSWIGRHPLLVLFAVALLVPLGIGLHWWFLPNYPTTDAKSVRAIEVKLWESKGQTAPENHQDAAEASTTDPELIREFLAAIRTAKRAEEHKCPDSGTVLIHRNDGVVEEFSILPGHDERYYEYRLGSRINKMDREPFLSALRKLGITSIKLIGP
jgi:hypothetical protein